MNFQTNQLRRNVATSMSISQELRTVGQGLESLDVYDFDLRGEGNGYFAFGIPRKTPDTTDAATHFGKAVVKSALQIAWHRLTGRSSSDKKLSEAGPGVLRILFTPEGLLRLEAAGIAKRKPDSAGIPDVTRLAQVLRLVGEHVDAKAGDLLKVSKRGERISFEYASAAGNFAREEWALAKLYGPWLANFHQRHERPASFGARARH
jgi:hypothetical protein